jgi:hypothetical protein
MQSSDDPTRPSHAYDPTQQVPPPIEPPTQYQEDFTPPPPPIIPSELPYFEHQRTKKAKRTVRLTRGWIIVLSILAVLVVAVAAFAYVALPKDTGSIVSATATPLPSPTPFTPTPTIDQAGWTTIVEFVGSNPEKTDLFTVPANWRIVYLVGTSVKATLYTEAGQAIATIVDATHQESNVYKVSQAGKFYLDISSSFTGYTFDIQVRS